MKTGRTVRDVAVPGCGGGGEPGGDGADVPVDEPQPLGQQRAAPELLTHEALHHQRLQIVTIKDINFDINVNIVIFGGSPK